MNVGKLTALVAVSATLITFDAEAAVIHWVNRWIGVIMPPDSRDCVFLKLDGVSAPDSMISPEGWIAIPRKHQRFK